jgi:hypothetical protein
MYAVQGGLFQKHTLDSIHDEGYSKNTPWTAYMTKVIPKTPWTAYMMKVIPKTPWTLN